MYALMCFQSALLTEFFTTHFTGVRAPTAMYTLMSGQIGLATESLITHITSTSAQTAMYALMSYQAALLTECPIGHFTWIWTLTPMYITGISAFFTVYMKLFIRSSLVRTRLKIRVFSDRKNNYFYSN